MARHKSKLLCRTSYQRGSAFWMRLVAFRSSNDRTSVVNGNILNSKGVHVGVVVDDEVFNLKGQKLYDLKGSNIYKLNGDLVGHLSDARGAEKRWTKQPTSCFRQPDLLKNLSPFGAAFAGAVLPLGSSC